MSDPFDDTAGDPTEIVTGGLAAVGNYAVIGHPVAHSKSPELHTAWFRAADLPGAYTAVDISPDQLVRRGPSLPFEFTGINVTIPHKIAMLGFVDRIDATAEAAGAANLIYRDADKAWTAGNTDGAGFLRAMEEATGESMHGRDIAILGAGGAARAIGAAVVAEGGVGLTLINRSLPRAQDLADRLGAKAMPLLPSVFGRLADPPDLIINTLPPGADPALATLSLDPLPDRTVVVDISYYNDSPLLAAARERNLFTLDGRGMLLWQAVLSFEAWTGLTPDIALGRRILGME
jgi:shikimate dehydrogenase